MPPSSRILRALSLSLVLVLALAAGARGAAAQVGRMGDVDVLAPGETPPTIVLITIGRGALIFEKFGHTALCLDYAEAGRETICFNYGTTDFTMPPFTLTWNFIRGVQKFFVEPVPLAASMMSRSLVVQLLAK